jgi:hypothetical protein
MNTHADQLASLLNVARAELVSMRREAQSLPAADAEPLIDALEHLTNEVQRIARSVRNSLSSN